MCMLPLFARYATIHTLQFQKISIGVNILLFHLFAYFIHKVSNDLRRKNISESLVRIERNGVLVIIDGGSEERLAELRVRCAMSSLYYTSLMFYFYYFLETIRE